MVKKAAILGGDGQTDDREGVETTTTSSPVKIPFVSQNSHKESPYLKSTVK